MIRRCTEQDIDAIYEIINDAAIAYKGIIPKDRWHEPYLLKTYSKKSTSTNCMTDSPLIIGLTTNIQILYINEHAR